MRKPVLFTAFVAVFFCLLATACGKKESSDVRPELTETRNTLKSLQEQQSELERKVTALEQLIQKNNQEVARLNIEIQRTADNAKRQALEQSKRTLLSELQTLESNKQGLERTLEELKARISSIEEPLTRLENKVSSDKDLQAFIGKWQIYTDEKKEKESWERVYGQGYTDYLYTRFVFKKYASKVAYTNTTAPNGQTFTPQIGVKLLELNIQPGGKGYVRYQNTNPRLLIGQGETFQKDFTYRRVGNVFIEIDTPNVFSDLEGAPLASPVYVLKVLYVPQIRQTVLGIAGLKYIAYHKLYVPIGQQSYQNHWTWDERRGNSIFENSYYYDWQLSSDGKYWKLVSKIKYVEYKYNILYTEKLFEENPSVAFVRK